MLAVDPKQRITAAELLVDPWISGGEASVEVIRGSAERLERFTKLRNKLKAGIFAVLIHSHKVIRPIP